jgi:hypothetical protein
MEISWVRYGFGVSNKEKIMAQINSIALQNNQDKDIGGIVIKNLVYQTYELTEDYKLKDFYITDDNFFIDASNDNKIVEATGIIDMYYNKYIQYCLLIKHGRIIKAFKGGPYCLPEGFVFGMNYDIDSFKL